MLIDENRSSDDYVEVFEPAPEPQRFTPNRRRPVDFGSVPPSQWKIHDRLENWRRWCRGSENQSGSAGTPMFNLYRSSEAKRAYGEETSVPVDKDDALLIHFAIVHPEFDPQCRRALQWNYLRPRNPSAAAHAMGTDVQGLADLVVTARQLLIDRLQADQLRATLRPSS